MSVHEFSQKGFAKGTNELYNTVRPTYSAEAFARIRQKFDSDPVDVVEIASGTGLFTRALLAHPDWQSIRHLRAVEPSEGMRESFAKHTVDERVELLSGTFDSTGLASGSADMIAIAQAFHWCLDHDAAAKEFARVLKPGGILVLIWNNQDMDVPWIAKFRKRVVKDRQGTPDASSGKWRALYDAPSYKQYFAAPEEQNFPYGGLVTTIDGVVERGLTSSAIASTTDAQKAAFVEDIKKMLKEEGLEEGVEFPYPYKVQLATFFLFRWITKSSDAPGERNAADILGFRPKNVTQDMIDTIHTMFPDIPPDNIRYDLMRTGSVELSSNKILERGFLDPPPPAYYTLYPRNPTPAPRPAQAAGTSSAVRKTAPQPTLIERYNLQERVEEKETFSDSDVGGKALWEDTAAKREASLKERKAQMILAARQRMLAAQQQPKDA
uniref:CUE domain-containing protein n=1 Tax=Mycena chlorophos TaxID=658473 RepID=A0ABQ0M6A8_MYCCL|nr:predicted protein [Mycena chlorophos]